MEISYVDNLALKISGPSDRGISRCFVFLLFSLSVCEAQMDKQLMQEAVPGAAHSSEHPEAS